MRLYKDCAGYSVSIVRQLKTVLNVSLRYAVENKLISLNPAEGIDLPKNVEAKPYHTRNIDAQKTLTMEQIHTLLEASKGTPNHMQVLFNVLMGLRRQEINGLKYSDVDYINRTLSVERQLGKELNRNPNENDDKPMTKRELPLKSSSSRRVLPIPDYVFEAILEERKIYERNRNRRRSQFLDADYICCSNYGKPRSKDFHWQHYKKLLKSDFNPKAVSKLMGHAKELITVDVYGDNQNIIPEEIPELLSYMEDVMPKKNAKPNQQDKILDADIARKEYLPTRRNEVPSQGNRFSEQMF